MFLDQYQKMEIEQFMGLWNRGSNDDVPPDHATDILNMAFTRRKDIKTRDGTLISFAAGRNVVRSKIASFDNSTLIVLTCDGAGNIYREDNGSVLLSRPGMVDFEIINIFDKVIIAPILSSYSPTNYLMIWPAPGSPVRPVAGNPPPTGMTAAETGTGSINAGEHCFAVCFKTDTGYITSPQGTPYACVAASGGKQVTLSNIPIGPSYVVARVIIGTKANDSFFYAIPNGTIADNTTTTLVVDFPDTALTQSRDLMFDLAPSVIVAGNSCGLTQYRGRLLVVGGLVYNANNTGDDIAVSSPTSLAWGGAEAFDTVSGFIHVPTQNDGNGPRCATDLFGGVLYIFKSVGIFSTRDNGGDPDTWEVDIVDGSVGCYPKNLASITGSQNSLGISSVLLLADQEGLFLFNGNVMRPEISWKIKSLWNTCITPSQIRVAVDPFKNQIYVILPVQGKNLFFVGDYSLGLDYQSIRWSIYSFPFAAQDIMMGNVNDNNDYNYWLRIGAPNGLYKLTTKQTTDSGSLINAYWQTALLTPEFGSVNVYRYLRYRAQGSGTIQGILFDEGLANAKTTTQLTLSTGTRDLSTQINFVNEKCSVKFTNNDGNIVVSRFQLFGKPYLTQRPSV
jgi:hypothetical protein